MKIGFIGLAGSGKDTVAAMVAEQLRAKGEDFKIERFASPLKRAAELIFGSKFDDRDVKEVTVPIDPDAVLQHTFFILQEVLKFNSEQMDKAGELYAETIGLYDELSPRKYQQLLGSDIVREIDENVWAKRLNAVEYSMVIPDVRFPQEVAVCDHTVLVTRHPVPEGDLHVSERMAAEIQQRADAEHYVDFVIHNDAGFKELEAKVAFFIKHVLKK